MIYSIVFNKLSTWKSLFMISKKKNIASLIFIGIFVVYVFSPLMFSSSGSNLTGLLPFDVKDSSSDKALHVSFEKLIFFKFTHNDGKKEHSNSEVIVHKARTIIPEDKIIKMCRLHILYMSEENPPSSPEIALNEYTLPDRETQSSGFQSLSSGLSPPAA